MVMAMPEKPQDGGNRGKKHQLALPITATYGCKWQHPPPDQQGGDQVIPGYNVVGEHVIVDLDILSKNDRRKIKEKLLSDLERVRICIKEIEAKEKSIKSGEKEKEGKTLVELIWSKKSSRLFNTCTTLLTNLVNHPYGSIFAQPVDVEKLKLEDYYHSVDHPMDLGTIRGKLSSGLYKSPKQFAEDVRLTFQNAMIYNPKEQDIHYMAQTLLTIFEQKWEAIEGEFELGSSSKCLHGSKTVDPVKYEGKSKGKAVDMTFEQKKELGLELLNLPEEEAIQVVEIIQRRKGQIAFDGDNEVEFDVVDLDPETLLEIDEFLKSNKQGLKKNKRKVDGVLTLQEPTGSGHTYHSQNEAPVVIERVSKKPKPAQASSAKDQGDKKAHQ